MLCLAVSLIIPCTGSLLEAQAEDGPSNLGWATLGLGAGIGGEAGAGVLGTEVSFQHGVHLFSGRALFSGEPFATATEAKQAALLYGRAKHGRRHQIIFSVGPAILGCQRRSMCGNLNTR